MSRGLPDFWVCGPGVGRGYLNRPALTAERFIYYKTMPQRGGMCLIWISVFEAPGKVILIYIIGVIFVRFFFYQKRAKMPFSAVSSSLKCHFYLFRPFIDEGTSRGY
jgi:hypothetical protein